MTLFGVYLMKGAQISLRNFLILFFILLLKKNIIINKEFFSTPPSRSKSKYSSPFWGYFIKTSQNIAKVLYLKKLKKSFRVLDGFEQLKQFIWLIQLGGPEP